MEFRPDIIGCVLILIAVVAFIAWKDNICMQKHCPDGLLTYTELHTGRCLCVREAE